MSEKKKMVPQLRFPGFSGEWEERKLGEIAESFEYGLNAAATEFDGMNKYLRITDIDDSSRRFKTDSLTSPDIDLSSADNYKLQKGDVLFTRTGASVGKTYRYIESDGLVYYAGFLIRARIKSKFDSEFIFQNTLTSKYDNFIRITSQRSGQPGVNAQEYSGFRLLVPELVEQKKIGEFFSKFDHLITLHQRKLTHLQTRKKGLLQKMFPKDGELFPELRFPGFRDAWEQRKSEDIFYSITDKNHTELPVLSASQEFGMVKRDEIGIDIKYDEKSTKTYKRVVPGQFVIHLRSFQGGFAYANIEGITSPAYTVLDFKKKEKYYPLFWREVLTSKNFIKRLESVTYGIRDGRSISFSDFSTLKFNVPSYEEQKVIGDYLIKYDTLITLHQRKLDHLQTRKKALLQQLFV